MGREALPVRGAGLSITRGLHAPSSVTSGCVLFLPADGVRLPGPHSFGVCGMPPGALTRELQAPNALTHTRLSRRRLLQPNYFLGT